MPDLSITWPESDAVDQERWFWEHLADYFVTLEVVVDPNDRMERTWFCPLQLLPLDRLLAFDDDDFLTVTGQPLDSNDDVIDTTLTFRLLDVRGVDIH